MKYEEFNDLKKLSDMDLLNYVKELRDTCEDLFQRAKNYKFNYPCVDDRKQFIDDFKVFKNYMKTVYDDGSMGYSWHTDLLKKFVDCCQESVYTLESRVNSRDYWIITNELGRVLKELGKVK